MVERAANRALTRLEALRDELLDDQDRIRAEIEAERGRQDEPDEEDVESDDRSIGHGAAHHVARRLREVDAAIRRLKTGRYGTCVKCGESIAQSRLHANPLAERCLSCQTDFEGRTPFDRA